MLDFTSANGFCKAKIVNTILRARYKFYSAYPLLVESQTDNTVESHYDCSIPDDNFQLGKS
jgi:hypothetical protein